ncbi:hypothetical protein A4G99_11385 [Haladaptatus sp. R4]|uniref:GIDE domain-containing protein n=1 Tax=Haladaptatus sp. R4 TaxID=1679489 RepID=UPI0007B4AEF9|nr:GIDE domain-containing protein [Haladaptatus sp. R4]KZN23510.1 hypothetical protein A4G99_11385 [Haladaptatus sp. R4]
MVHVSLLWRAGIGVTLLVVGLYQMNKGRNRWAQAERIADVETTRIRDLRPGGVEIKGTVQPPENGNLFESPIETTDAIVAHVTVEEEQGVDGGSSWETIHEAVLGGPITIDDGTGTIRVELPLGEGLNLQGIETKVGRGDEPPEKIRRYVANEPAVEEATRKSYGPVKAGDSRRYSEGVIEPGEDVYVLGNARRWRGNWEGPEFVIDAPTEGGDFILSDKSENDLVKEGKDGAVLPFAVGGLFVILGLVYAVLPWLSL